MGRRSGGEGEGSGGWRAGEIGKGGKVKGG